MTITEEDLVLGRVYIILSDRLGVLGPFLKRIVRIKDWCVVTSTVIVFRDCKAMVYDLHRLFTKLNLTYCC
jgi:hypothetical protein